jgi:4-amino-4-deoxy-L-arabinose transferase-like glycosyltransferase
MLSDKSRLWLLMLLFAYLAALYSIINPIFEASDEVFHYPMVKHIADGKGLPVLDENTINQPWRQEGGQPPLYYMTAAFLTWWIDTSDMREVRRINPHANIGEVVPDGNANLVVHHIGETERFPWSNTVLAIHLARLLSVLMSTATIYFTYQLAKALVPHNNTIPIVTAALVALNPMFLFVSGSVNNDNLSNLVATILLFQITHLLTADQRPPKRTYIAIGLIVGIGMLAKFQIGFMIILIGVVCVLISYKFRSWRPLIECGLIAGGLTILIAGWWYLRNNQLYGDPTGIVSFLDVVGRRLANPSLSQLWQERNSFLRSFWGLFGGVNVALDPLIYRIFNGITVVGFLGFLMGFLKSNGRFGWLTIARLLVAIWTIIVFVALIRWTTLTPASQGRLMFSAIAPIMLLVAVGWHNLAQLLRFKALLAIPLIYFGLISVIYAPLTIHKTYAFPEETDFTSTDLTVAFTEPNAQQPYIQVAIHDIPQNVTGGTYLEFEADFQILQPLSRNWSVFIHLTNDLGIIIAQRDVYPGQGKLATQDLEIGRSWRNTFAIYIPESIYAPQSLTVSMGLYDYVSKERMLLPNNNDQLEIGTVNLIENQNPYPNTLTTNFGDKLFLHGYSITDRLLSPNDETTLTLYWEALEQLETSYVVSIQILDIETAYKVAQEDGIPSGTPTNEWDVGETMLDTRAIAIFPDAQPGVYRVVIRVYSVNEAGELAVVPIIGGTGNLSQDFYYLNWIRIVPE